MNCPDCDDDRGPLEVRLTLGVVGDTIVLALNRLPFPLYPDEARDLADKLVHASDIAEWTAELGGGR